MQHETRQVSSFRSKKRSIKNSVLELAVPAFRVTKTVVRFATANKGTAVFVFSFVPHYTLQLLPL